MKKVLVTTDFSDKSEAALFFGIQLSSQAGFRLVFFYVCTIKSPLSFTTNQIADYEKQEIKILLKRLNLFVSKIYKDLAIVPPKLNCAVVNAVFIQSAIIDYATLNKFNFICISTKGAGKLQSMLGTNTANLINHSNVPVIAVPYKYKQAKITSILYASDLVNVENELKHVVAFAKLLSAPLELLHFNSPIETLNDKKAVLHSIKKFSKYSLTLNIKDNNFIKTLVTNIEEAIVKTKPSLLIMFTEQNRSLFQKIFISSKSAEYSFNAKVPLLVFNKS